MSNRYPREFREDVVRVARSRGPGVSLAQIATNFGVSKSALCEWLRKADVDDGVIPGVTTAEHSEAVSLRRRVRLLEQENEVLRRATAYLSQACGGRIFGRAP